MIGKESLPIGEKVINTVLPCATTYKVFTGVDYQKFRVNQENYVFQNCAQLFQAYLGIKYAHESKLKIPLNNLKNCDI